MSWPSRLRRESTIAGAASSRREPVLSAERALSLVLHPERGETQTKEWTMSDASTPSVPRRRGDEVLSMLAERIGARLGAATVFGAPVERDGVTVVPVAVARFGFGGGSGTDPSKGQEGEGGGGGGSVAPTGYIELKDGRSRFVPIVHPARMLALIVGAIVAVLVIMRPTPTPAPPPALKLPWS